jgi:hypothetical protein
MTVATQDMNSMRKELILLKFTRILILGVASLIFNLSVSSLSFSSPKAQFSILYTNDVMGEVEPCG